MAEDPTQEIERWADYKQIEIAEWHVDEDESGGTHNRPRLGRAVEGAVTGETGGIVSWKIDRFNYPEGGLRDLRRLEDAGAGWRSSSRTSTRLARRGSSSTR